MGAVERKGGEPNMRTTLTRALLGLGLAGALFLGAGAAVAQTTDEPSSGAATTTDQTTEQGGARADCPERNGNQSDQSENQSDAQRGDASRTAAPAPGPLRGRAAPLQSQPRRLKTA
jgi:hypothetical protein